MNKHFYSFIFILATVVFAQGQSLEPEVLAVGGSHDEIPGASFSWTVGEMTVVSTASAPTTILTQGFHQPFAIGIVGIEDRDPNGGYVLGADLSIYPNPTAEILHLRSKFTENVVLHSRVIDLQGKEVYTSNEQKLSAGVQVTAFNLAGLAQGSYIFQLTLHTLNGDHTETQNVKINILPK